MSKCGIDKNTDNPLIPFMDVPVLCASIISWRVSEWSLLSVVLNGYRIWLPLTTLPSWLQTEHPNLPLNWVEFWSFGFATESKQFWTTTTLYTSDSMMKSLLSLIISSQNSWKKSGMFGSPLFSHMAAINKFFLSKRIRGGKLLTTTKIG